MPLPLPPRRRHPRRQAPSVHRPPAQPAPETASEVLERSPDVSRETSDPIGLAAVQRAVNLPEPELVAFQETLAELEPAPSLSREQILKLEAVTAQWVREVRIGGPGPDDTLLYSAPRLPPVPPARPVPVVTPELPAPTLDPAAVAAATEELLSDNQPAPVPVPDARREEPAGPARRVSDWTSRHDPRSLEFHVRQRLARAVPIQDVVLDAGPVLDQGTAPPLSLHDASACVGMGSAAAANVLTIRAHGSIGTGYAMHQEEDARGLYGLAQKRDHLSGEQYAGTSVLAGMKAGQEAGWWAGYLWALGGTKDIAQVLLQLRVAVVVGVPWSADLETPDAAGIVRPGGADLGGHCLAVIGMLLQVAGRPGPWFVLRQSRGPLEGRGGNVFLHHTHLRQLLAGVGEAAVPLPEELLQ